MSRITYQNREPISLVWTCVMWYNKSIPHIKRTDNGANRYQSEQKRWRSLMLMPNDTTPIKRCTACMQDFPATAEYFYIKRDGNGRLNAKCKKCEIARKPTMRLPNPSTSELKYCPHCKLLLPRTPDFWQKNKVAKDGLQSYCKKCHAGIQMAWNKNNRDRLKAYQAKWYVENKGRLKVIRAIYLDAHREEAKARSLKWWKNNLQRMKDLNAKYAKEHPEKIAARWHRRRSNKIGLPVHWTTADMSHALSYWQDCCAYCSYPLPQLKLFGASGTHFDHYIALSDPRRPHPGTTPQNMLPVCAACNLSKGHHDPIVWLTRTFGARKSKSIIKRINIYFESLLEE